VEELGDVDEPKRFSKQLKEAVAAGETLGGVVSIQAEGVPRGLGSPFQQSLRLDGAIASAMMTIPAVKALEIGEGIAQTEMPGSVAQDKFDHSEEQGIFRTSNLAGGVEGGCSNGEAITVRLFIKPIPTLPKHMKSIDPVTGKSAEVVPLRSDVTAVFATVPIARARMQLLLADFLLERFGGQTLGEVVRNYQATCLNFPVEQA
jgi:chorismate synthase